MKNLLLSFAFALIAGTSLGQNNKIGFVDVEAVIAALPEYNSAQSSLNSYAETLVPQNVKNKAQQLEEKYKK